MGAVPDDYEPPETTPQIGALRAYVEGREHADHDTFSMGREFAGALLGEYDRLLYLAEVKYELLRSERGYDLYDELDKRLRKLYMTLNAEGRGDTVDLDGDVIDGATKWNGLVELAVAAAVHWLANAQWAVLEHRSAEAMRDLLREIGDDDGVYNLYPGWRERIAEAIDPPAKPEGAVTTKDEQAVGAGSVREERYRYEPLEPVPADWRFIRNDFDHEKNPEHPYWALYTHEVDGDPIRRREWVELRQVVQRRMVTEWVDVLESEVKSFGGVGG
jgi:hypothetical protein